MLLMMRSGLAALLLMGPAAAFFLDGPPDPALGNASLWLSSTVYCSPETYLTRTYLDHIAGFEPTARINVPEDTTEGLVGYVDKLRTIFVAFRGSETLANWVDDLSVALVPHPRCAEDGCMVHRGFHSAAQAALPQVLAAVAELRSKRPGYSVVVTGHSLGAALSTLTAVELAAAGFEDTHNINFGSPRIGNTAFAAWASVLLGRRHARFTHERDAAVHCPLHERFTHLAGEVYEEAGRLRLCEGFEDPTCSFQWSFTTIEDHMWYMGKRMGAAGCGGP